MAATAPTPPVTGTATTAEIWPVTGSRKGANVTALWMAIGSHGDAPYTVPLGRACDEQTTVPSALMMSRWLVGNGVPAENVSPHFPAGDAMKAGIVGLSATAAAVCR